MNCNGSQRCGYARLRSRAAGRRPGPAAPAGWGRRRLGVHRQRQHPDRAEAEHGVDAHGHPEVVRAERHLAADDLRGDAADSAQGGQGHQDAADQPADGHQSAPGFAASAAAGASARVGRAFLNSHSASTARPAWAAMAPPKASEKTAVSPPITSTEATTIQTKPASQAAMAPASQPALTLPASAMSAPAWFLPKWDSTRPVPRRKRAAAVSHPRCQQISATSSCRASTLHLPPCGGCR